MPQPDVHIPQPGTRSGTGSAPGLSSCLPAFRPQAAAATCVRSRSHRPASDCLHRDALGKPASTTHPANRCLQSCLANKALALVTKQTNKKKDTKSTNSAFVFVQYLRADGGQAM